MNRHLNLARHARWFVIASISASIVLSGCATTGDPISGFKQVVQNPQDFYITNAVGDSCAQLREPFVQVREEQRRTVAKWAGLGAMAGTAGGAALDRENRLRGALIGMVAGLTAGATAGYYADLQKRSKTTESLRSTVFADAKSDARSSDELVQAVTRLNRCRLVTIQAVADDVRSKKITKEEAQKRLAAIRRSTAMDDELIGSVAQGLEKRTNFYVNALQQSGADNPDAYVAKAAAYKPVVIKPKYTVSRSARSIKSSQPKGVTVQERSKRGETSITSAAKNNAELKALQIAHQQTVEESIKDTQTLIL